jgi:hypothetical protein
MTFTKVSLVLRKRWWFGIAVVAARELYLWNLAEEEDIRDWLVRNALWYGVKDASGAVTAIRLNA